MQPVETSGKTVEDALSSALKQLGASREDVDYTVLDEGRRAFLFGRDARVRVELKKKPGAEEEGRGRRGRRGGRGREGNGSRERDDRPQGRQERGGRRDDRGGRRDDRGRAGLEQTPPKLSEQDFFGPGGKPAARPGSGNGSPGRDRGGSGGRDRGSRDTGSREGDRGRRGGRGRREGHVEVRRQENITPNINADEVDFAATIVDDILQILEIEAEIQIREPETHGDGLGSALAVVDISADEELGFLIGRRGDSLLALQYLVNLVLTRRYPDRGSITIDVEHYRKRREEQVLSIANRMADRVRESGTPITLEPMSPAERRIVHLTLADDPELETSSVGDGDSRKVVISLRP